MGRNEKWVRINLQLAAHYHVDDNQDNVMATKRQESLSHHIYPWFSSLKLHWPCWSSDPHMEWSSLITIQSLKQSSQQKVKRKYKMHRMHHLIAMLFNPLQHNVPFPKVYSLSLNVISCSHCPLILVFTCLSHNRCISISWINGHSFLTLDMLERVIPIHGDKHVKDKLRFTDKLMHAIWTGMTKPPSWIIMLENNFNMLINAVANEEVDVKAVRELLTKIRLEGGAMEVTECLNKGMD